MLAGGLRITFYMAFVLAPLFLAALFKPVTHNGFLYEIGRGFALISFMVLNFQPSLASRLKWIERPLGLDIVIRHHKYMAVFATFLLICHPLLLSTGKKGFSIIIGTNVPWLVWLEGLQSLCSLLTCSSAFPASEDESGLKRGGTSTTCWVHSCWASFSSIVSSKGVI